MPELLGESGGANGASGSSRLLNGVNGVPLRQRSRRKQSSPMMPPFMVSAPGKVIVFGEHAVVHGKVSPLHILVPGRETSAANWLYSTPGQTSGARAGGMWDKS